MTANPLKGLLAPPCWLNVTGAEPRLTARPAVDVFSETTPAPALIVPVRPTSSAVIETAPPLVPIALAVLSELNVPLPLSSESASRVTAPPAVVMSAVAPLSVTPLVVVKPTVPTPVVAINSVTVIKPAAETMTAELVALRPLVALMPPTVRLPVLATCTPPVPPTASRLPTVVSIASPDVPTPDVEVTARLPAVTSATLPPSVIAPLRAVSVTVFPAEVSSVTAIDPPTIVTASLNVALSTSTAPVPLAASPIVIVLKPSCRRPRKPSLTCSVPLPPPMPIVVAAVRGLMVRAPVDLTRPVRVDGVFRRNSISSVVMLMSPPLVDSMILDSKIWRSSPLAPADPFPFRLMAPLIVLMTPVGLIATPSALALVVPCPSMVMDPVLEALTVPATITPSSVLTPVSEMLPLLTSNSAPFSMRRASPVEPSRARIEMSPAPALTIPREIVTSKASSEAGLDPPPIVMLPPFDVTLPPTSIVPELLLSLSA